MPYCNRCGVAFGGTERFCQSCDKSTSNALVATTRRHSLNQNNPSKPAFDLSRLPFGPPSWFMVSNVTFRENGSVTVELNPDRARCGRCRRWFLNDTALGQHLHNTSSGCWEHRQCFGRKFNYIHAQQHQHSRCFAPGCRSVYGLRQGWPNEEIKRHVWEWHTPILNEDTNRLVRAPSPGPHWAAPKALR